MEKDLFTWQDLLECEPNMFMFGNCTFKRDFGSLKEGDKFDIVSILIEKGEIHCETNDGNIQHVIPFTLQPK